MLTPTADGELPCSDISDSSGPPNLATAAGAISGAEGARSNGYPYNIQPSHLGVAVHPYSYDNNSRYGSSRQYANICSDLADLINTWTAAFPGLPLVFTEDNWDVRPLNQNSSVAGTCPYPSTNSGDQYYDVNGCAGTYQVDLFTWLHDHNGYDNPSNSPLRVMWFTGVDYSDRNGNLDPLGLYGRNDADKSIYIGVCPGNSAVAGSNTIALDYDFAMGTSCY